MVLQNDDFVSYLKDRVVVHSFDCKVVLCQSLDLGQQFVQSDGDAVFLLLFWLLTIYSRTGFG